MTAPEPQADREVDDLGLSPDARADLRDAWNTGAIDPAEGTVEEEALRRMDAEVHQDYVDRCARDGADAAYSAWAQGSPRGSRRPPGRS